MDDSSENESKSYNLLKSDPETVEVSRLDILATIDWKEEKELHVRMLRMLLDDASEALSNIESSVSGGKEGFERAVHYFKGSADVVRADRLAMVCKLVLKLIRVNRLDEAEVQIHEIRARFEELKRELLKSGYLD